MEIKNIKPLNQKEQLDVIGNLFDLAFDNSSLAGIAHAFSLLAQIDQAELQPENLTLLYYDLSNGWGYRRKIKNDQDKGDWQFLSEELTNEIVYLRKAIASPGFANTDEGRQCQIYTNLGNSFSFIGRFIEAQQYWNQALKVDPSFAMAIGNKANGLFHYGRVLYDNIHSNLFYVFAYHHLTSALKLKEQLHHDAKNGFQQLHEMLKNYIGANFPAQYIKGFPDLNNFDLGTEPELKKYRLWALENGLFINPLNDLGDYRTASHDCLNMPTLTVPFKRAPVCINLYNQMKQEFATARYAYYVSIANNTTHFSDIDVPLVDTMETIRYSYYGEQLKIAFRMAYSILDKIAYLLNDYLDLQIKPSRVSFRTLWYDNEQKRDLRPFFKNSDNWALRGLYWLSKDLYEKEQDFDTVLEPDAREVATIRNYIEHKGFKVVSDFQLLPDLFTEEDISYSISRSAFEQKTLKLLKLTRAAIIYVAVAISHEEVQKEYRDLPSLPIDPGVIPHYRRS